MTPAYRQVIEIVECRRCGPSKGRVWERKDVDGQPVVVTAEPCEKHQRMLDHQGWALQ